MAGAGAGEASGVGSDKLTWLQRRLNAQLRQVCYAATRNLTGESWDSETWGGDLDGCPLGCGLGRGPEPCKAAELAHISQEG